MNRRILIIGTAVTAAVLLAVVIVVAVRWIAMTYSYQVLRPSWYELGVENASNELLSDVVLKYDASPYQQAFGKMAPGDYAAIMLVTEPIPETAQVFWTDASGGRQQRSVDIGVKLDVDLSVRGSTPRVIVRINDELNATASLDHSPF